MKFDHQYMKKWLLREQPEDKLDIRLWQTFRNIDLQTAIKLHEDKPGGRTPKPGQAQTLLAVVPPGNNGSRKGSIVPVMFVSLAFLFLQFLRLSIRLV